MRQHLRRIHLSPHPLTLRAQAIHPIFHFNYRRRLEEIFHAGSLQQLPKTRAKPRPKKMALATVPLAEQIAGFLHLYARVAASPVPILFGDQSAEHESRGAFHR
jgi:hypothetical protein